MSAGRAIHIGLNHIDPRVYQGWDGALDAGENDAVALAQLTADLGYDVHTLLSAEATAEAVLGAIGEAAESLTAGDICVLTYAGHGGQFADLDEGEADGLDETWLLYDREVLDDELRVALARCQPGVRVVVVSDSCHSGSVVRGFYQRALDEAPEVRNAYARVAPRLRSRSRARNRYSRDPKLRGAPPAVQAKVLAEHGALYRDIRARTPSRAEIEVRASVLLLSGCQDNQESMELDGHGVFTAALLDHWDQGRFTGDYPALHTAISDDLPPTQSPGYLPVGSPWPAFEDQRPFTIDPPERPAEPAVAAASPDGASYRLELSLGGSIADATDPVGRLVVQALTAAARAGRPTGWLAPDRDSSAVR